MSDNVIQIPPNSIYDDFGSANNLGPNIGDSFIYTNRSGFNSIAFKLVLPVGSKVAFFCSFDGINYVGCTLRSVELDDYIQIASNDQHLIGSISGARFFKVEIIIAGTGYGSVIGRASQDVSTLEGIENSARPDNFGNAPYHVDATFAVAQTGASVWTPSTDKKVVITDIIVTTDGLNVVTVYDEVNVTGNILFEGRFPNNSQPFSHSYRVPFESSAQNNVIRVDSTGNVNLSIFLNGYEIN